jgi:hypothetical protein
VLDLLREFTGSGCLEPTKVKGSTAATEPARTRVKKLLFFGLLFALGMTFFSSVRDNAFWHPTDFQLVNRAMDARGSWAALFVPQPHGFFQPLVSLIFFAEYLLFGLNAQGYYLVNILIHSINAFLVFLLVETLLKDRAIAILSSLLFLCAVGNYGKAVMVVAGLGDLLITMLTLLTLLFYFRNQLEGRGSLRSKYFIGAALCFVLSLFTKTTSFSILGCMFAFNVFFRSETRQRLFNHGFVLLGLVALGALLAKHAFGLGVTSEYAFVASPFYFIRNYASYLTRMVFPIHASSLIAHAGPVVQSVYNLATEIRALTFLCIVSLTLFGFIFGNRTLRFFFAWTFITVTPFCFFEFPQFSHDWLDIRHLYLVSVGFSMILASVTVMASRLLEHHRWRRALPFALPLLFVFLSQFIISELDTKYELISASSEIRVLSDAVAARHESLRNR